MKIQQLSTIPIAALELNIRSHNALLRAECSTLGELQQAIESNSLWTIKNLGEKSITEIQEKMQQYLLENNVQQHSPFTFEGDDQDSNDLTASFEKQQVLDVRDIANLPLNLLNSYLHEDQVKLLSDAGVQTIGQLNGILENFESFLSPNEELLGKSLRVLTQRLRKQVQAGSLSEDLRVGEMNLGEYLQYQPANLEESLNYLQTLKQLIKFDNLDQEMEFVFSGLTERQEYYYLKYHLENKTLEALSQEEGKTRERIRQIISDGHIKIESKFSQIRLDYVNSALAIAKNLDGELSRDRWESELESHQLIKTEESRRTINRLFAILSDKKFSQETFETPENVSMILKKAADVPVYVLKSTEGIPGEQFKAVNRKVMLTGGIHEDVALKLLGCKPGELRGILAHRGLVEIEPNWFSVQEAPVGDSRQSLLNAGLKMWRFCGPLPFDSFYDGLQRYISRYRYELSPAGVVTRYLEKLGFHIEEGLVVYEGDETIELSGSEQIALQIIEEQGPVISFQEMVTGFLENNYSAASAISKVMGGSAVVERIGSGYYVKRGAAYSGEDLERAISRQESAERESTISFTSAGKVRYQTIIDSWAMGGTLNIGKLVQYLPDLEKGCQIFVGDKEFGTLAGSESMIWGLTPAFTELDVRFGDYIELEFDNKKQLKVFVNILQRQDSQD